MCTWKTVLFTTVLCAKRFVYNIQNKPVANEQWGDHTEVECTKAFTSAPLSHDCDLHIAKINVN